MLFVDIAGFTSMCERVPPDALSGLVSQYFETMSSLVMSHSGLIDKYIGDCIMAVWGAPFAVPSKAARATLCGLRIDRETRVDPLLSAFDAEGEQLSIRVGIASGVVLAGNMGSAERMNYTVIGDAVNLASRIEGLNKALGTRVAVDDDTAAEIGTLFILRTLVNVAVVGKKDGVRVHEVVGINPDVAEADITFFRNEHDAALHDGTTDDTATQMSFRTASSDGDARREVRLSVLQLVDQARRLQPTPLGATAAQISFAARFTEAMEAYIAGDFSRAEALLPKLAMLEHNAALSVLAASSGALPGQLTTQAPNEASNGGGEQQVEELSSASHLASQDEAPAVALLRTLLQQVRENPPTDMGTWDGIWRTGQK